MVDIDFENYKLYADGVQINKTPSVIVPPDKNKKSDHPVIIKMIVGNTCNYSCKYCSQYEKEKFHPIDINEVLRRMDAILHYDNLHEVQIWGGEPLLYFDSVKEICQRFYKTSPFISIVTNGSLLDREKIDFFNKHHINVCISHNGPGQATTRGEDPLELHKDIIKDLAHLNIACCLTKDNFDLCEINDWFYNKFKEIGIDPKKTMLNYSEIDVLDERTKKYAIKDLAKYQLCLRMFFDRCRAEDPKIISNNFYHYMSEGSVMKFCQDVVKSLPIFDCTKCCLEFADVIIVDSNGYLRECQNLDCTHNFGVLEDLPNKMYQLNSKCKECRYRNLCKSACPVLPEEYFNENCAMNMARCEVVADFGLKIISKEIANISNKS